MELNNSIHRHDDAPLQVGHCPLRLRHSLKSQ